MAALPFWPSLGTVVPLHTRVANGVLGKEQRRMGPSVTTAASVSFALKPRYFFLFVCVPARAGSCFSNPKSVFQWKS